MMEFKNRTFFFGIALIGVLIFASPTMAILVKPPVGEQYSVIYLLGPSHNLANLPFNIKTGVTYSVYLGVINEMGSSEYYTCSIKLGNETAALPNATLGTASSLPALYEYNIFVSGGATWEAPLTLQVNNLAFNGTKCQLSEVTINGVNFPVSIATNWDSKQTGFYNRLIVELSIYNAQLGTAQYNHRFVSLTLNMTQ